MTPDDRRAPVTKPVTGPGTALRWVLGVCIVVVMASVTIIALKVGAHHARETSHPASTTSNSSKPQATNHAATSATGSASKKGTIAAPVTTKPPRAPKAPTKASDLGVLVNKKRPLSPTDYAPRRLTTINGAQMRADAGKDLERLQVAARKEGHQLTLLSGYRSAERQNTLHRNYVERNGRKMAETFSAKAGESEHQTGLAADLGTGKCDLEACFGDTAAGKWLAAHAHEYGFIIRYPKGQQKVTGYTYEPWHLRYLGANLTDEYRKSKAESLEAFYGLK